MQQKHRNKTAIKVLLKAKHTNAKEIEKKSGAGSKK